MVWKKFMKKNRGGGQWKDKLTVRMDFPVRGVTTILHVIWCSVYAYTNIV
jgi:hypothetical protein